MKKLKKILEREIAQRELALKHNPLNKDEIGEELTELKEGLVKLFAIHDVSVSLPEHCTFWNKICDNQICDNGGLCTYDNRL